ncbi:hypothetical protein B4135_0861 [Caldibacillus debilis]|uniref:Uncharacterized protein n=1 Tax=Caldibacillus debilis TaxID=301148 RepID=A0A150M6W5_9BACI|nr:hypothetical protein B4135_0861 [Caldibacillus debilis]
MASFSRRCPGPVFRRSHDVLFDRLVQVKWKKRPKDYHYGLQKSSCRLRGFFLCMDCYKIRLRML